MNNPIEQRTVLQCPHSDVWSAVSDHEKFGAWFRVALDGPFVPGQMSYGHMTYPGYEHLKWEAEVKEVVPESYLSFTWHPFAIDPEVDYSSESPTLVEFHLSNTPDGVLLRVVESGFENVPAERRETAYQMNSGGWAIQMKNIADYLAKQSS